MGDILLRLPWPPSVLSPNNRTDRRTATKKRAAYRAAGWAVTHEAKIKLPADAHLEITFYPPDNRRRDLDNMLASIKCGLDGIAEASGVDDYGWSMTISRAEKVKHGAVIIHVREPARMVEMRGVVA